MGNIFEAGLLTCLLILPYNKKIVEAQGISEEMPNYNNNLGKYLKELELCPILPESQEEKDQIIKVAGLTKGHSREIICRGFHRVTERAR